MGDDIIAPSVMKSEIKHLKDTSETIRSFTLINLENNDEVIYLPSSLENRLIPYSPPPTSIIDSKQYERMTKYCSLLNVSHSAVF